MKLNDQNIQNDFESFINSIPGDNEPRSISFAFRIEIPEILFSIDKLNAVSKDIFFFRTPNNNQTIIALNSAFELTSNETKNFQGAFEGFNSIRKNLINNWDQFSTFSHSIICCTAKFDAIKSQVEWDDFQALRIYVPEILILIEANSIIGYFNFTLNNEQSYNEISNTFTSYLRIFFNADNIVSGLSAMRSSTHSSTNQDAEKNWDHMINDALSELRSGTVNKLVLSRAYSFKPDAAIIWSVLLNELSNRFPDCYLFLIKKNDSIFFGSSPEMFLRVSDNIAEVESVAGSAPRGDKSESDVELEQLLRTSEKNHQEHLFVSKYISEILIHYSDNVRIIEEKQIRKLDNIQHLITRISAQLNSKENLFELIDSLFPTPAVCGVPKEIAKDLIRKFELHDRGLYSGLIGLMDFDGNCEIAVSIRSALIRENKVTAFAGAGLVSNSDPEEEFNETTLKLNTILSLFSNENKSK